MLVAYCLRYPTSLGIRYAEDEMDLAVFAQDFATAMGGVDARAPQASSARGDRVISLGLDLTPRTKLSRW